MLFNHYTTPTQTHNKTVLEPPLAARDTKKPSAKACPPAGGLQPCTIRAQSTWSSTSNVPAPRRPASTFDYGSYGKSDRIFTSPYSAMSSGAISTAASAVSALYPLTTTPATFSPAPRSAPTVNSV